ncbi:putative ribonuclease H-like domain-containing protein [Tanacetum coccineum]
MHIVIKPVVKNNKAKASKAKPKAVRKNNGTPIIEDWVSNNEEDDVPQAKIENKTFKPSFAKIEFVKLKQQEKTARKTINYVEQNRQNIHTPRGNQRNWNNMMSQRLGSNFEMFNKTCYVCGSFDHLQVDCKKNIVPRAVLMKSSLVSVNTARQVNAAHTITTVNATSQMSYLSKTAHSTVKRVVNTARPKAVLNAVKGNQVNVVKASACLIWKAKTKQDLQEKEVIDSGCLRHMTGNMFYLTDFEEIDKGYVTFGETPKGGKIIGKVPRKNNMYSVDLKNIVPKGGLTCLFAKFISNESKLWHRRLGHINFKTMNKLGKQDRASYDYSRFSWVFFLATKDETSGILKSFITGVENLIDQMVKVISVARTPQQNGVAERKNRTLIKAARIMLADSKLPTTFWAEAVNTACYVQNRVLVTKPHNKTPYELFLGRKPALGFMRPFRCPVTILNTIYHLGKFDGKADEGFFVGYSINSKAFRVFNSRTRIVEENLHVQFSENTPNIAGSGPNWLFDIDALTNSKSSPDAGFKPSGDDEKKVTEELGKEGGVPSKEGKRDYQEKDANVNNTNSTNSVYTVSSSVNTIGSSFVNADGSISVNAADLPQMI